MGRTLSWNACCSASSISRRSRKGPPGSQALQNTLDLARLTDQLGYHRYWVAEHHGGPMLAGPSPGGADRADRGRDGAHPRRQRRRDAPALQPVQGRGDVQRARRPLPRPDRPRPRPRRGHRPDDHARAPARPQRRRCPDDFPEQLDELLGYFEGTIPLSSPLARLQKVLPGRPETPQPWLLGSSPQSAVWAADLGLPYAFADFINNQRRRHRPDLRRASSRTASGSTRRSRPSRSGRSPPTARRRPSASRPRAGWRSRCCAAGA